MHYIGILQFIPPTKLKLSLKMDTKLPKQLAITLNGLIDTSLLSSWTMHGNENITTLTIRFKPDCTAAIAEDTLPSAKYKRVSTSQTARDIIRATEWKNENAKDNVNNIKDIHISTNNTSDTNPKASANVSATILTSSANAPSQSTRSRTRSVRSHAVPTSIQLSPLPQIDGATNYSPIKSPTATSCYHGLDESKMKVGRELYWTRQIIVLLN